VIPAYRAFVIELCRRVAEANPQTRFVRGRDLMPFLLEHGFLIAMLVLLAAVVWAVGGALRPLILLKLAILAFYVPYVLKYARTNRPAPFAPRQVPLDVLPK
jgi:hypothetical protein